MRTDIVHIGAGELTYEIRNIVNVGNKLQKLGLKTNWENIGDPVAKGEEIPCFALTGPEAGSGPSMSFVI